jgi:hypothetical protein
MTNKTDAPVISPAFVMIRKKISKPLVLCASNESTTSPLGNSSSEINPTVTKRKAKV